jgi:hypothetical protein
MTSYAQPAGSLNLATLSTAERQSIEEHKADCLVRWSAARDLSSTIYVGLKSGKTRLWAETQLKARPDIEAETRRQLNLLLKVKR